MPLYDYAPTSGHCERCHGRFEVQQRIADAKLTRCPTCDQPVERLISPVKVTGKYSTSDRRVKELGMTKYKKAGAGRDGRFGRREEARMREARPNDAPSRRLSLVQAKAHHGGGAHLDGGAAALGVALREVAVAD